MSIIKLFDIDIDDKFLLPDKYKGNVLKNGGITKNNPRRWTKEEIEWVEMLKEKCFSIHQISKCIDRDPVQVQIKMKRIAKKNKTYNQEHIDDKYYHNDLFLSLINPKSVLDLYAGANSYYTDKVDKLITNDINEKFGTCYSEKAEKLVCKLWYEGYTFDLIDIDPFGSAYDCFDLSIKMAKKGLIITIGEMGHKRFKRIDFVSKYYNIHSMSDFNTENIMSHIINIGKRNKKNLLPIFVREWRNISRIYFKIQ